MACTATVSSVLSGDGRDGRGLAEQYKIAREEGSVCATSQQRAAAAQASGRFDAEIVPITIESKKGATCDEHLFPDATMEKMESSRPSSRKPERLPPPTPPASPMAPPRLCWRVKVS